MEITIKYSTVKHGRVRLTKDGNLNISIPKWKKNDKAFQSELISKGKKLLEKKCHSRANDFIGSDYVTIFGKKRKIKEDDSLATYLKEIFMEALEPIVEHYSDLMGSKINKISVKNLSSKWGSCSSNRNISINLKLVHLPLKFTEYVVVHELAHLKHPNHSSKYRAYVEQFYPHYKIVRKELRRIIL